MLKKYDECQSTQGSFLDGCRNFKDDLVKLEKRLGNNRKKVSNLKDFKRSVGSKWRKKKQDEKPHEKQPLSVVRF